jgi:hypothetical protein
MLFLLAALMSGSRFLTPWMLASGGCMALGIADARSDRPGRRKAGFVQIALSLAFLAKSLGAF